MMVLLSNQTIVQSLHDMALAPDRCACRNDAKVSMGEVVVVVVYWFVR